MLGLFSSKPDHPLADAREARRVVAALAASDPRAAVEEGGNWLDSLATTEGFKLSQRLALILDIEAAVLPQARRLGRDYLAQGRASHAQESMLWEINHDYWAHVVAAYASCIERHRRAEKDADAITPQLPLLYVRQMHALAAQLKWGQFRYEPVAPGFWLHSGGVYLAATAAGIERTPQLPYPGATTSIEAEYLKALVFHAASMDKLRPLEIEIAERFIACFLPLFTLDRKAPAENAYWVDAAQPLPPTRLTTPPEITPSLRFFSGTGAVAAVEQTIARIGAEHRVPPDIPLGDTYGVDVVVPVLEHLARCWAPTPPIRSHVRHRVMSHLDVVHGFAGVYRQLAGAGPDAVDAAAESWAVEDVSLGGLGALVPIARKDWIRIGVLVGMRPEGGDNWLLGIVRRYARSGTEQGAVGIETLSRTPRAILADAAGLRTEAILLDLPVVGDYVRVVLAPAALEDQVALLFSLDGMGARLHPRETLASGADYVVVNFFVQSFS